MLTDLKRPYSHISLALQLLLPILGVVAINDGEG